MDDKIIVTTSLRSHYAIFLKMYIFLSKNWFNESKLQQKKTECAVHKSTIKDAFDNHYCRLYRLSSTLRCGATCFHTYSSMTISSAIKYAISIIEHYRVYQTYRLSKRLLKMERHNFLRLAAGDKKKVREAFIGTSLWDILGSVCLRSEITLQL